jgi:hypothetical protein
MAKKEIAPTNEGVEIGKLTAEEMKQQQYFEAQSKHMSIEIANNLPHEARIPFLRRIENLMNEQYLFEIKDLKDKLEKTAEELMKFKEGK